MANSSGIIQVYFDDNQGYWTWDFIPTPEWIELNVDGSNARTFGIQFHPFDTRDEAVEDAVAYATHINATVQK